jgi:hypothetical protein
MCFGCSVIGFNGCMQKTLSWRKEVQLSVLRNAPLHVHDSIRCFVGKSFTAAPSRQQCILFSSELLIRKPQVELINSIIHICLLVRNTNLNLDSWACCLFCSPIQIFSNFFSIPFCQTHGFDIQIYIVTSNCKVLKTKPVPWCSKHSLIWWSMSMVCIICQWVMAGIDAFQVCMICQWVVAAIDAFQRDVLWSYLTILLPDKFATV